MGDSKQPIIKLILKIFKVNIISIDECQPGQLKHTNDNPGHVEDEENQNNSADNLGQLEVALVREIGSRSEEQLEVEAGQKEEGGQARGGEGVDRLVQDQKPESMVQCNMP